MAQPPGPDPSDLPTVMFGTSSFPASVNYRYDVLGEVGRGGMGIVYKARDRETGAIVALKVLHPDIAGRTELIERFKTELVLARKITHKNVCRVYDLNRFDNVVAISMEYIEGEGLRALLNRAGGFSIRHGLQIVRQVIAGLTEAHAQGVVHRDLKPENILIAQDGTVKVMDFGIARAIDTDATLTATFTGTPAYMSPEQAQGKSVDARSDIYALGLVMYEMFCGQRAFTGDAPLALAMKQVQETPPPPREHEPHVPAFIDRVILKCIEKNPAKRFQSVSDLDAALVEKPEVAADTVAAHEDAEPPMPLHLARWQRSDWTLVSLAIVGLLMFFPLFERTSLAPRSQVSFDRSVLLRIAQENAQKIGAPIGQASEIQVLAFPDHYDYVARRSGSAAALELSNNPVPYWVWRVKWENATSIDVDNRGSLWTFDRDFLPGASSEKLSVEEGQVQAEKAVRDFLGGDPSNLRLDTAGDDIWRGHAATKFTWSDPKDYHGLHRQYIVRLVGKEVAYLESGYPIPPSGFVRPNVYWQIVPWGFLYLLVLPVVGFSQRRLVDLYARWRIVTLALFIVAAGSFVWSTQLPAYGGALAAIFRSMMMCLSFTLLTFFILIAVERSVRRVAPTKLSTIVRLFDRRAVSEPCGLGILRGTLVGLALLGMDALLVWLGTGNLGMRLDSFALLFLQSALFLNNPFPGAQGVLSALWLGMGAAIGMAFLTSSLAHVVRRSWLAVFLAAALAAVTFPGIFITMGAVQPYPAKVLLLFFDLLILAWTFTRFDVLTLFAAAFTCFFFWQNYALLVMFRPIGAFEEWVAFAVWGLLVAAAAAVAFKPALLAAYRRAAVAFQ